MEMEISEFREEPERLKTQKTQPRGNTASVQKG